MSFGDSIRIMQYKSHNIWDKKGVHNENETYRSEKNKELVRSGGTPMSHVHRTVGERYQLKYIEEF
jgi:hypothetical protein